MSLSAPVAATAQEPAPGDQPPARPRRQPPLLVWLSGLGIRARIAAGFAIALLLLVVVAAAAVLGIQRGEQAFGTYDAITENGRRIQKFERDIVDLRRSLLLYVERDDPRGLLGTRRLEPALRDGIAAAVAAETDSQRRALLEQIPPLLDRVFGNLGEAIDARNTLKQIKGSQLDVYGPKAHEELMQLIRAAMRGNDMATAAEAGLVMDALSEIRLAANQFIGQGDMAKASEARAKVKVFVELIDSLKGALDKPALKEQAENAENFARQYEAGIINAASAAADMNRLIYQTMEEDIGRIADLTAQVQTSEQAELQAEQSAAALAFRATFLTVLVLSAVALAVGLLFAVLIGRNIANPIAALTGAMTTLAAGDYATAVPGLQRRDEIGRMAAAVEVFKQNGAENERLRGEVEAERQAAERRRAEQEALLDRAVGEIVAAAAGGDLTRRIDTAPLQGAAETLGSGINRLLDAVAGAIDAVGTVLAGLAEGDLTRRVAGDYAGVFARLQQDVNTAGSTLGETLRHIADSAGTVRAAAGEISAGSQDLASRTESQAATLEQTAAAMHEVTATVKQNADNAQAASQLAVA
ncbi:HAMP domain-containing protein, partial [Ferrovibrio sp.]|uniref:HAMP domain-containing protein n=1 Tax=Ferrovibrio sp. TaxID=1917215 RepID=UPI00311D8A1E